MVNQTLREIIFRFLVTSEMEIARKKELINERTKAYFSLHVHCMDRRNLKCARINVRTVKVKLVHYRP